MTPTDDLPAPQPYSLIAKIIFWLLWSFGAAVGLLFLTFAVIAVLLQGKYTATWNLSIVYFELFILIKSARYFFCKNEPIGKLLLWAGFAAIAIPMIASGGCFFLGGDVKI